MSEMHRYRTHTCAALRQGDVGNNVRLSGWVHRVRDHGGLLFIDLRDHYGLTQLVVDPDSPAFKDAERVRSELAELAMADAPFACLETEIAHLIAPLFR